MHRHWHTRWNADVVGILRDKYTTPAFGLRVGKNNVRKLFEGQLREIATDAENYIGKFPTLIGETGTLRIFQAISCLETDISFGLSGIPMNLDEGASYNPKSSRYGDYTKQNDALDAILSVC